MIIADALLIVKEKIPEGYSVVVTASKGKIEVTLETPDGTQSVSEGTIPEQILAASDQAIDWEYAGSITEFKNDTNQTPRRF